MPYCLNGPAGFYAAKTPVTIEISEPPDKSATAFYIGEFIDYQLQGEWIDTDIFTNTQNLYHPSLITQKKMLLAINGF